MKAKTTTKIPIPKQTKVKFLGFNFIASYFTTRRQFFFILAAFLCGIAIGVIGVHLFKTEPKVVVQIVQKNSYWLVLHRKSNKEFLYIGEPGDISKSKLVKTFSVKSGIPNERPTPLPHLLGRDYWILIGKMATPDNPETAPYFITLNVPLSDAEPFGPLPYVECNGQCNWILPGAFGLHGVGGDNNKLSKEDPGSSGCIRHSDEDITYLYNLLDPNKEEIRYYIYEL